MDGREARHPERQLTSLGGPPKKGHWSLGVHGALTEDSLWATGPHAGVQEQQGGLTEITEAEVREQRL